MSKRIFNLMFLSYEWLQANLKKIIVISFGLIILMGVVIQVQMANDIYYVQHVRFVLEKPRASEIHSQYTIPSDAKIQQTVDFIEKTDIPTRMSFAQQRISLPITKYDVTSTHKLTSLFNFTSVQVGDINETMTGPVSDLRSYQILGIENSQLHQLLLQDMVLNGSIVPEEQAPISDGKIDMFVIFFTISDTTTLTSSLQQYLQEAQQILSYIEQELPKDGITLEFATKSSNDTVIRLQFQIKGLLYYNYSGSFSDLYYEYINEQETTYNRLNKMVFQSAYQYLTPGLTFLVPKKTLMSLYDYLAVKEVPFSYIYDGSLHLTYSVEKMREYTINELQNRFNHFLMLLNQGTQLSSPSGVKYFATFSSDATKYLLQLRSFSIVGITLLVVLGIPIVGLCFFLVDYTFNLLKNIRLKQIKTLKSRGISNWQIFALLIAENVFSVPVILFSALLFILPIILIFIRSDGIFSFNGTPFAILFPNLEFLLLVAEISFFLALLMNLPQLYSFVKTQPNEEDDGENPFGKDKSFWKDKYIDIILIIYGIVGYLVLINFQIIRNVVVEQATPDFFTIFLAITTPFSIVVGLSLLISRIYSYIIHYTAKWSWNRWGNLVALGLKHVRTQLSISRRTSQVIALGLAFSLVLVSFPSLAQYNNQLYAKYQTGSDISIEFSSSQANLPKMIINDFQNEIKGATVVTHASLLIINNPRINRLEFLAVDPFTYTKGAFIHPTSGFTGKIQDLSENNSIMLFKKSLNFYKRVLNGSSSQLNFYSVESGSLVNVSLKIVGTFKFVSLLIDGIIYYTYGKDVIDVENSDGANPQTTYAFYGIIGKNTLLDFQQRGLAVQINKMYLLLKTKDAVDVDELTKKIIDKYGSNVDILNYNAYIVFREQLKKPDVGASVEEITLYFLLRTIYFIFNTLIGAILLINAIFILLFGVLYYNERWKEFGVERAIGLKKRQIFLLSAISLSFILILGESVGIIIGIGATSLIIVTFFSLVAIFPPIIFQISLHNILIVILVTFISFAVSLVISFIVASRKPIISLLKAE